MILHTPLRETPKVPKELLDVMEAICDVSQKLAQTIADGELAGNLGASVGTNLGGDGQKALDIIADEAYSNALKSTNVRWYASEEQDEVVELNPKGSLALAIDPLDGSSNIDTNVSIGMIFSIYNASNDANESFLRPANEQIAAGYFIFGPQCALVVTFGNGTMQFTMDSRTREFLLVKPDIKIPNESSEYAINASNYRHWQHPIRAFVDDCVDGSSGPRGEDFNMRWIASLVAETHRILSRGGIFLYPSDARKGYENGRLRMVYECAPIAFLIEQAGGKASNSTDAILDLSAKELHARVPFIFGSKDKVEKVSNYFDLPNNEISALFSKRGLFRN